MRVSVYDEACAEAVKTLTEKSPVPLVADIHFDYKLAIRSAEKPGCGNWRTARRRITSRSGSG